MYRLWVRYPRLRHFKIPRNKVRMGRQGLGDDPAGKSLMCVRSWNQGNFRKLSCNLYMLPNPSKTSMEGRSRGYRSVDRVITQLVQGHGFDPPLLHKLIPGCVCQ